MWVCVCVCLNWYKLFFLLSKRIKQIKSVCNLKRFILQYRFNSCCLQIKLKWRTVIDDFFSPLELSLLLTKRCNHLKCRITRYAFDQKDKSCLLQRCRHSVCTKFKIHKLHLGLLFSHLFFGRPLRRVKI